MPFTAGMEDRIINDLNDTRIKRRFRSPAAIRCTRKTCRDPEAGETHSPRVRRKDIWVWTGYKLDELNAQQRKWWI